MADGQFVWVWQVGVASEYEIRGVGRLMKVGMVMVAVFRVVDPVIFRFKICLFTFHTSANSASQLRVLTSFYHFSMFCFCPASIKLY